MASSESAVTNKILGLPPRWSNHVDPGGRVFSELFLKDGFIFNVIPGTPKFNGGVLRKQKMSMLERLGSEEGLGLYKDEVRNDGNIDEGSWFEHSASSIEYKGVKEEFLKEKDLRFYSFYPNFSDYKYVINIIMNDLSTRLIGKSIFLNRRGFSDYVDDNIGKIWRQGISFYAEANSTYSEGGGNNLQDSAMSGMVNNASAATTEVAFLTGSMSRDSADRLQKNYNMRIAKRSAPQIFAEKSKDIVGKALSGVAGYALKLDGLKGVIQNGERLIFPKVWGGSNYNKSYNLNFKFFSPSGDKESILQYVYFPFVCLMALAMPLQGSSPDSFKAPFLVRCDVPGYFACDMGMVTSFSFTKGGYERLFTAAGLPQVIDAQISIEDIYSGLALSTYAYMHSQNIGMKQMIQNMAGLEYNRINFMPNLRARASQIITPFLNFPGNVADIFKDKLRGLTNSLFGQ
jgi:hypothetical protein